MKIAISAESTIDLPQELLDKYKINIIPFGITFDGELKQDKFGISTEIFEYVEKTKTLPKTSAIAPQEYKDYFENLRKDHDAVIHISLSSMLSSSCGSAMNVAKELDNVYVVDSLSLSTGIALLAIFARSLADKKLDPKDIYEACVEKTKYIQASFVIEKLNYLHKGGRCSALTLLGANILKIKPQIVVSKGKMGVGKKYMGNLTKCIEKYCDELLSEHPNADKEIAFITHSSPMGDIEKIVEEKLKANGFKTIYNTLAGGTISSHCGPNTLGVLFISKDKIDNE